MLVPPRGEEAMAGMAGEEAIPVGRLLTTGMTEPLADMEAEALLPQP